MANSLDQLIIEPTTEQALENYLARPAHSLMLVGASGVGLGTIAQTLGHAIAGGSTIFLTPTTHKQQKTSIINADDIADLIKITRDKRGEPLAIVINDADKTAPGVFERLLKLIEEPVPNICYIITTHNLSSIPATIMSRSNVIRLKLPNENQCASLLSKLDTRKRAQIEFLAPNQPAEIRRLIDDEAYFGGVAATVRDARSLLTGNLAARLELISDIKDRDEALKLCQNTARLITLTMRRDSQNAAKWVQRLNIVNKTADSLALNANLRLELLNLALAL